MDAGAEFYDFPDKRSYKDNFTAFLIRNRDKNKEVKPMISMVESNFLITVEPRSTDTDRLT